MPGGKDYLSHLPICVGLSQAPPNKHTTHGDIKSSKREQANCTYVRPTVRPYVRPRMSNIYIARKFLFQHLRVYMGIMAYGVQAGRVKAIPKGL